MTFKQQADAFLVEIGQDPTAWEWVPDRLSGVSHTGRMIKTASFNSRVMICVEGSIWRILIPNQGVAMHFMPENPRLAKALINAELVAESRRASN